MPKLSTKIDSDGNLILILSSSGGGIILFVASIILVVIKKCPNLTRNNEKRTILRRIDEDDSLTSMTSSEGTDKSQYIPNNEPTQNDQNCAVVDVEVVKESLAQNDQNCRTAPKKAKIPWNSSTGVQTRSMRNV